MVIWMKGTVVERQRSGCIPDTFESRVKKKGGVNLGVKHKAKGCSLIVGIRTWVHGLIFMWVGKKCRMSKDGQQSRIPVHISSIWDVH